jgi:hypothetical protein
VVSKPQCCVPQVSYKIEQKAFKPLQDFLN